MRNIKPTAKNGSPANLVDLVAQTLCRAAANGNECQFCNEKGKCDPEMWSTFRYESQQVIGILTLNGYLQTKKPNGMLPGLGG